MTYVVGVDFGTLSARALVVRAQDGTEMGSAVHEYPHAVMERSLASSGAPLPPQWALQDPSDYVEALQQAVSTSTRRVAVLLAPGVLAAWPALEGSVPREAITPSVDGELDPSVVSKEVKRRLGAIKACYERALKRNPSLSGKVVVFWTITEAGTVSGLDIEQDTLGDPEVSNCIKALVKGWRFPRPSGGSVDVSFPFLFQSSS